jgi:hypothetical protein
MPALGRWLSFRYKKIRAIVFVSSALLTLAEIAIAQIVVAAARTPSRVPPEVSAFIPLTARDVSYLETTSGGPNVTLAAWSEPSKKHQGSRDVGVVAVRSARTGRKLIWHLKLDGAYSPTLVPRADLTYQREPIVLLQTQYGAAAARIDAVGIAEGKVRHLCSIEGNYFDYTSIGDTTYLVAHDDVNLLDVPHLYRWTGASFADDSQHHPQFYAELAIQIRSKSDISKFAPPVRERYAQILCLSAYPSASCAK